jgi:hypothetical protein
VHLASYPGVEDDWLDFLDHGDCSCTSSIDLSHCREITDDGLMYIQRATQLEKLALNGCLRLTDVGLCNILGESEEMVGRAF